MDIPIISKNSKGIPLNSALLGNRSVLSAIKHSFQKAMRAFLIRLFGASAHRTAKSSIFD